MLGISLSAVSVKEVENIDKTWLKYIEYAESEFRSFEFVRCKFIVVCESKVNEIYWNSKIIVETCFQGFYWVNRVRWFRIWYCQQDVEIFVVVKTKK